MDYKKKGNGNMEQEANSNHNSQSSTLNSQLRKGVYIVNGKKVLF